MARISVERTRLVRHRTDSPWRTCWRQRPAEKIVFGEPPNTTGQRPVLPRMNQSGRLCITSYLQLRELDLFAPPWSGASPSSHSSFREEVFSVCSHGPAVAGSPYLRPDRAGRLQPNEVERTNILAPGFAFFPPSPPEVFRGLAHGKLYPVTAAQLLPIYTGFLAPIHFFQARKELKPRTSGLRFDRQDYLITYQLLLSCRALVETSRH
jgi:hypothetical protein